MNREFNPTSKPIRSALAAAALAVTMFIVGAIDGLAQHYDVSAQVAQLPAVADAKQLTASAPTH